MGVHLHQVVEVVIRREVPEPVAFDDIHLFGAFSGLWSGCVHGRDSRLCPPMVKENCNWFQIIFMHRIRDVPSYLRTGCMLLILLAAQAQWVVAL